MDNKSIENQEVTRKENKVTLGIRCNPTLKLQLALTAQNYGFTLSEYVESILNEVNHFQKENETLKSKVNFYENDFLKSTFEKFKNTNISFIDKQGSQKSLKVNSIQDIYSILIQTVKV